MKQQHGFAHAVLIIGLMVALIGALGFIFWQNFVQEETEVEDKVSTRVKAETKEKSVEVTEDKLLIDEYGVEFSVPNELKDTSILYEQRTIGAAEFLAFTTERVVELGGDCAKGYPFGDLVRLTRQEVLDPQEYYVHATNKIKGYYYQVSTVDSSGLIPESTCTSNKVAANDLSSLVEALKTLEAQN